MANGFLGNNASLMLDVVVCALALVVPTLLFSIFLVKFRHKYLWHRNIQVGLGIVLLLTVAAFEIDIRMQGGWEEIVNKADRPEPISGDQLEYVRHVLWVHLVFAITTPLFWVTTIVLALKRFPSPPVPGAHSGLHKKLGWASTIDITLTSVTGLYWYSIAFMS